MSAAVYSTVLRRHSPRTVRTPPPESYRQLIAAKLVFLTTNTVWNLYLAFKKRSCFHDIVCYDHAGDQKSMIFHMRMGRDNESLEEFFGYVESDFSVLNR